jgi:hypothetical protein
MIDIEICTSAIAFSSNSAPPHTKDLCTREVLSTDSTQTYTFIGRQLQNGSDHLIYNQLCPQDVVGQLHFCVASNAISC